MKEGIILLFGKLLDIFHKKSKSGDKQQEITEKKNKYIFKGNHNSNYNGFNYVCSSFFISWISDFGLVV